MKFLFGRGGARAIIGRARVQHPHPIGTASEPASLVPLAFTPDAWASAMNGTWSNGANWSLGTAPGASNDATLGLSGTYHVGVGAGSFYQVHSLTMTDPNVTLSLAGQIWPVNGLALSAGTIDLLATGSIYDSAITIGTSGALQSNGGTLIDCGCTGTINLNAFGETLNLAGGLNAGGGGPAVIDFTGGYDILNSVQSGTLANTALVMAAGSGGELTSTGGNVTVAAQSSLKINGTGGFVDLDPDGTGAQFSLTNQGSITAAGYDGQGSTGIYGLHTSFLNAGSLLIENGESLSVSGTFTNIGTITLTNGGGLYLDGTITAGGLGAFTNIGDSGTLAIGLGGVLENAGTTLTLSNQAQLTLSGSVAGGTIADAGDGLINPEGVLLGVDYEGTLDLDQQYDALTIDSGLNASAGAGAGTIVVGGTDGDTLYFGDTETVGNATIEIGDSSGNALLALGGVSGGISETLTLASAANIVLAGAVAAIVIDPYGTGNTLINEGTITADVSGGTFEIYGGYANDNFSNQGSLVVGNGAQLILRTDVSSLGNFSTGSGGSLVLSAGDTLNNQSSTLSLGSTAQLTLDGTISGGVIDDTADSFGTSGDLLAGPYGGTLSGVGYLGSLYLNGTHLTITNGFTLNGLAYLNGGSLDFSGSQSVSGGDFYLGTLNGITGGLNFASNTGAAATLTVSAAVSISLSQSGSQSGVIDYDTSGTGNSFVDSGSLSANVAGGTLYVAGLSAGDTFTSLYGYLDAANGATLDLSQAGSFGNDINGTLTGFGVMQASGGSTILLTNNADITALGAGINLFNGSVIAWYDTGTATEVTLGQSLVQITGGGDLNLAQNFTAAGAFTDDGVIQLNNVTFADAAGLTIGEFGVVQGSGTIAANLTSFGDIYADGGAANGQVLDLTGGGALGGTIQILSSYGATLTLDDTTYILNGATIIDDVGSGSAGAALIVDQGAVLGGNGSLGGSGGVASLSNAGAIMASGGTLTLAATLSGNGTLGAAAGGTLDITMPNSFANAITGAGTVELAAAATFSAGTSLSVADLVLGGNLSLGRGENLAIAAADTVAFEALSGGTLSLSGANGDTVQNAGSLDVFGPGALQTKLAVANTGTIIVEGLGTLDLQGPLTGGGSLFVAGGALLDLSAAGTLSGGSSGGGTIWLGGATTLAGGSYNNDFDVAKSLSGHGTIGIGLVDNGTVTASGGTLLVAGAVSGAGGMSAAAGAVLDLAAGGILASAISGKGTLALGGAYVVGAALPAVSYLSVAAGASLTGAGTFSGAVADAGLVAASGGALILAGALSGAGTLSAGAGAVLDITKGGSFAGVLGGAGTVRIAAATTLEAGASLAASDVVITANLALGAGENLASAAGNTLSLGGAGAVTLGGSGDTLANAGTLLGSGAKIGVALINTGLASVGAGTLSFAGAVTNDGTIAAGGGTAIFSAPVQGTGVLDIGAAGTLSLLAGAGGGQTVDFAGATALLDLTGPSHFLGAIAGFATGDQIDLIKTVANQLVYAGNVLKVEENGKVLASLAFDGSYSAGSFALSADGHGGSFVTLR